MSTWLEHLGTEECRERLAESVLGRIAVIVLGHPEIFPVNHVYDRESNTIAFPSNDRTKLHAALYGPAVAFEVDGMDEQRASGWSVLVVGRVEEVTDERRCASLAARRTVRWAPAPARWLQLVPTTMTGRRISYVLG